jgi:hypothetical protein
MLAGASGTCAWKSPYRHGEGVATYLARYLKGGPLKNQRLVAFDGEEVSFRYGDFREADAAGRPKAKTLRLSVVEFLGRLLLHVPPPGDADGALLRALRPEAPGGPRSGPRRDRAEPRVDRGPPAPRPPAAEPRFRGHAPVPGLRPRPRRPPRGAVLRHPAPVPALVGAPA